jgi:hypothetical protein
VPGANSSNYLTKGQWQLSSAYRTFRSHRHFTGATEDVHRSDEESEVINNVHFLDLSATYALSQRFNLFASLPIMSARRSLPIRNAENAVMGRYVQRASGIGDLSAGVRFWVREPSTGPRSNLSLGLGLKFPSGASSVTGLRRRFNRTTGEIDTELVIVDQSIQPGDGGFGALVQLTGFWLVGQSGAAYVDGSYLLNPENTNGVATFRTRPSESIMSIADQYLLRVGGVWGVPWVQGLSLSLGSRLEGVPVRDLIGASSGFRRPGFSLSVEPGVGFRWGASALSLNVPVALHRERQRSVTDLQDGRHGDAAFADFLISVAFVHVL